MNVKTTIEYMTLTDLAKRLAEDQIILRETIKEHVQNLRKYLINGIDKKQAYLPMLVVNKASDGTLQMIDGSTRARAIYTLYVMLQNKKLEKDETMTKVAVYFENSSIGIQVFHQLTEEECDQLYIDFNTKGKKVALSKLIEYDSRHLDNQITNMLMETNTMLKEAGIDTEKRSIIRPTNRNFLSLSQLRQIVKIFMEGYHLAVKKEGHKTYPLDEKEYVELINAWINELFKWQHPRDAGNYHKTLLASFPVILSLAYYVNEEVIDKPLEDRFKVMKSKMKALDTIDWSSENKLWEKFKGSHRKGTNLYFLSNEPATIKQLVNYYHQISFKGVM
ncbi:DNA sulfur modification protein DndB [uncultured Metabacillus sp.]|uniref:DNA sulfur modification protein DndB n=1 Tax=uncultured Metabacillus sp. TaxID=2860135 RepID=UPI00262B4710|nr:DNA sulfur modification protein DndB [uncultured Metabacillus sp.]